MLALENVSWTAADGEEILRNISLEVPDGKMTVITGPNGGGKTSPGETDRRTGKSHRRENPSGRKRYHRLGYD